MMKRITALFAAIACLWLTANADQVHRVSPGETIGAIAQKYGITADTLLGNNPYISDPDRIYSGQVLIIPEKSAQLYRVRPGDTLFKISRTLNMRMELLATRNNIADLDSIVAGQVLQIPQIYTVRAGESLSSIAQSLGLRIADLAAENNLQDLDLLLAGQHLVVPAKPSDRETLADYDREQSPRAAKFPDTFFYKGAPGQRRIALTFDDGPATPATAQILDLLKVHRVPATFFLLGRNVEAGSALVQRMVAEGHTIAGHNRYIGCSLCLCSQRHSKEKQSANCPVNRLPDIWWFQFQNLPTLHDYNGH